MNFMDYTMVSIDHKLLEPLYIPMKLRTSAVCSMKEVNNIDTHKEKGLTCDAHGNCKVTIHH